MRESYFLLTVCTLAMMLMASSVHLLALVLALELSSYSLYHPGVPASRQPFGAHVAGLRYFMVGVCASAIMLFGLALIYAATGALHIDRLADLAARYDVSSHGGQRIAADHGRILFQTGRLSRFISGRRKPTRAPPTRWRHSSPRCPRWPQSPFY
jgi:formate hydrogenlyase subunit 3/multisubunit Na+/H+ antiporter MnhD subunit